MDFQEAAMSSREEMHKSLFSTVNGFQRERVVLVTAWNSLKKNQDADIYICPHPIILFSLHACASKGFSTLKGT